jgi:hypothetical protein
VRGVRGLRKTPGAAAAAAAASAAFSDDSLLFSLGAARLTDGFAALLQERYKISADKVLGSGGFATVYQGLDSQECRGVAHCSVTCALHEFVCAHTCMCLHVSARNLMQAVIQMC